MAILILVLYGLCLTFIFCYSLVQLHLTYLYLKARKRSSVIPELPLDQSQWPCVTVQLPVYNEMYVIGRLLDAVARLDYPKEKLEVQVLDDSTDETTSLIRGRIRSYQDQGVAIELVRRPDRSGYKAGALRHGLKTARGEFIAIFDADFVPASDFLLKALPAFQKRGTGVVQTRWGHLNRDYSLLTRLQAFGLDAHFSIEQVGRQQGGNFLNFNGTAGIWRKTCITDAGGWQADTLTEDLDLSYRAQLRGWAFVYLEQVETPAELPAAMPDLKSQQFRWTKGAAENAVKNLNKVLRAPLPFSTKIHAFFHLLNSGVFLCVLLTALLSVPVLILKQRHPELEEFFRLATVFLFGLLILGLFYGVSYWSRQPPSRNWKNALDFIPQFILFLALSMGLSLHNTIAVLEGYFGIKSPFVRTPKFNLASPREGWRNRRYATGSLTGATFGEGALCLYFLFGIFLGFKMGDYSLLPFHVMLGFGFGAVFFYSVRHVR